MCPYTGNPCINGLGNIASFTTRSILNDGLRFAIQLYAANSCRKIGYFLVRVLVELRQTP